MTTLPGKTWDMIVLDVMFPSLWLTRNNRHKSIRALGRVALVIPLLPWTLFCLMLGLVILPCAIIAIVVAGLWEDV